MTDPATLAGIHRAAFTVPRPWSAAEIAAVLGTAGTFLCAEAEGFLLGRVVADEAELLTLAVLPGAQRSGVGIRLVASFLAQARARGAATAYLEVAADNAAALGLYARAGFSETGRRKDYYTAPDDAQTDALILSRRVEQSAGNF